MQIYVAGSHRLSEWDKKEIYQYLEKYAAVNHIHLLAFKSIENEVLRFFLENEALAPRLSIYTLPSLECLPEPFCGAITYLQELGASHQHFYYYDTQIAKTKLELFQEAIIEKMDLVCCFYNGDKPADMIPVDVAKQLGVQSAIYDLPKQKKHLIYRSNGDKIRLVN